MRSTPAVAFIAVLTCVISAGCATSAAPAPRFPIDDGRTGSLCPPDTAGAKPDGHGGIIVEANRPRAERAAPDPTTADVYIRDDHTVDHHQQGTIRAVDIDPRVGHVSFSSQPATVNFPRVSYDAWLGGRVSIYVHIDDEGCFVSNRPH